ncbi:MAG: aryl-sulfate sulfotransferase [Marinicellaceae bacterium]
MYHFKSKSILFLILCLFNLSVAHTQTMGLLKNTIDAYPGYTLFSKAGLTYLINNTGEVVHTWSNNTNTTHPGYLAENGDLFVVSRGIKRLDWQGNVIWRYVNPQAHHDAAIMPNGNVLLLVSGAKTNAEVIAAGRDPSLVSDNIDPMVVYEINPQGEIVWQWHVWDHLIQDFDASKDNYGIVENHPELVDINFTRNDSPDWLHGNAINYNAELDQILLSPRFNSEIWIIDHSTTTEQAASHSGGNANKGGDLLYRWGNPIAYRAGTLDDQKLFGSHDAQWIKEGFPGAGNIIIYNNGGTNYGRDGNYSTIDEITPPLNGFNYEKNDDEAFAPINTTWSYSESPVENFYSSFISGVQRLENGNTLIDEGENGRLFEVKNTGEIVWEYQNSVTNSSVTAQGDPRPDAPQPSLFRANKYDPEFIESLNLPLINSGPIELYNSQSLITLMANETEVSVTPGLGQFSYGTGQLVTIHAMDSAEYEFSHWSIISGEVSIDNPDTAYTTLTIQSTEAEIQANYNTFDDLIFLSGFDD